MRSYMEILTELKETIESDAIPDKEKIMMLDNIDRLFILLWPYSD